MTDAARVKDRSDLWELTVEPAGPAPVSILAPLDRPCTEQGALCTADGRSLTAGPALVVPGPPADNPPGVPDQPAGTAVFIGGVDLEWNDVPGADSYAVQLGRGGQWIDLPADGVEVAFYGAGAIISGLDPEASLWFQVRAANAHGVSDWSATLYMSSTSQFKKGRKAMPDNKPASGAPVVHGTAQAGESLRADASGIEDRNGLDRVQFRYQWTSNDGTTDTDIAGATDSGYTLLAADVGKTIKARVAFTDRRGYSETRTSAATDAVEAAPQPDSPATGQPTISGTAQVGEQADGGRDPSGIADADGLTNATYSYQWLSDDAEIGGGHRLDLHPGGRRRGPDHQGAGHRHRRSWERDNADQRGYERSGGSAPARQSGNRATDHHRHGPGGRDADGGHYRHRRRGRIGQRDLQLPMGRQ